MQLSIIIVSYNVRYFLEQCLLSVQKAMRNIDGELIVVDNASQDGTLDFLQPLFPGVQFIANETNTGFAKANNKALARCRGEYVLFLNPDTLLPEDCLEQCLGFIGEHPGAAAMGIRMLDGSGRFLPESKRAFPSLRASFFKLTGLAALFPRSGFFNQYALGQLNQYHHHKVEVLAGAFILARRQVLEQLGGFDERFFLYGEDIDLSYRIRKAGYQVLYFAGSSIIHFKGESAASAGLSRVKFFYQAMLVFVQKHYQAGAAKRFAWLIRLAITIRGGLSFASRILKPVLLPLIDFLLVWLAMQAMRGFWISQVRQGVDFHVNFLPYALPLFAFVFVAGAGVAGLYDKLYKRSRSFVAVALGFIAVLAVYAVLPESVRFSRGVIFFGVLLGSILVLWLRQSLFSHFWRWMGYEKELKGQAIIVGSASEYAGVLLLLEDAMLRERILGRVSVR
jgi:GT2 family glycosyltransferase